jgi:hypothetical protein
LPEVAKSQQRRFQWLYIGVENTDFAPLTGNWAIAWLKIVIRVAETLYNSQPNIQRRGKMDATATITEQRKKEGSHRHYAIEIQDKDDLRMLVAHLPGFWDTIEANDRTMVIEVWADPKKPPL